MLKPGRRQFLPRVHGLFHVPGKNYPSYPEYIPTPAEFLYTDLEPMPVVKMMTTLYCNVRIFEIAMFGFCPKNVRFCIENVGFRKVTKRGQSQVFTQSMLHSSWRNTDSRPRKGFIISWAAKDVPIGFTSDRCEGLREHFPRLQVQFSIVK